MSVVSTSLWAIVALALCAPFAVLTAVALRRARAGAPAVACLRFLSYLPLAALALALAGTHGWLGWWALGGYAPLALALRDAFRALDPRESQAAVALGLSSWQVAQTITLPLVARPALAAALRTLARLVGEAGLFFVVGGPTLGAKVWQGGLVPALALAGSALAWAALASLPLRRRARRAGGVRAAQGTERVPG